MGAAMDDNDAFVPSNEHMRRLSEGLAEMRDALVELSLSLKDARLALDAERRRVVEADSQELIDKIKANAR